MLLEVIEPITPKRPKCKEYKQEPLLKHKINNNNDLVIKYGYVSRNGPDEELYHFTTTDWTIIKQIKDEFSKSFIYGEVRYNQYYIYRGMQQHTRSERGVDCYICSEPILLNDDNNTLKDDNIQDL